MMSHSNFLAMKYLKTLFKQKQALKGFSLRQYWIYRIYQFAHLNIELILCKIVLETGIQETIFPHYSIETFQHKYPITSRKSPHQFIYGTPSQQDPSEVIKFMDGPLPYCRLDEQGLLFLAFAYKERLLFGKVSVSCQVLEPKTNQSFTYANAIIQGR